MQYKTILRGISYLIALLIAPAIANADILALYDFETPSAFTSVSGDQQALSQFPLLGQTSDVSASAYDTRSTTSVNGAGIGGVAFGSLDPHAFARTITSLGNGNLPANDTYHEFSLTVNNGTWSFDSLHFEYWVNGVSANETYQATIYSDLAGYAPGQELGTVTYNSTTNQIPDIQTVTIGDSNFRNIHQNLSAGTTVDFRLVFSDNVNDAIIVHRVDDVVVRGFEVEGVTHMPEPAAGTILVLLVGFTMMRRRRS